MVYCFLAAESFVVNFIKVIPVGKSKKYINKMIYSLYTAKNSKIEPYSHFFYIKMVILGNIFRQNLIKIYSKTHQIALAF